MWKSRMIVGMALLLLCCLVSGCGAASNTQLVPGGNPTPGGPPAAEFPHVYLLGETGVSAYRASDGKMRWHFSLPLASQRTTTMIVQGQIAVVGTDTALEALDAVTGALRWTVQAGPQIQSMLVSGTTLYVGSMTWVSAFALADGSTLWTQQVAGGDTSRLVLSGNTLYVGGSLASALIALDAESGALRWSAQLPSAEGASSFVPQEGMLFVQTRHRLEVLDASSGHLLWQLLTAVQGFQVGDGIVSLIFRDLSPANAAPAPTLSGLRALRASDGSLLWQEVTPVSVDGERDVLTPETIYRAITSEQGNLSAWSTSNGALLWQMTTQPIIGLIRDLGVLYASSGDTVTAFREADGTRLWQSRLTQAGTLTTLVGNTQSLYGVDTLSSTGLVLAFTPAGIVRWQIKTASPIVQFLVA
jgi:outer membrane protein assembly factor BamB